MIAYSFRVSTLDPGLNKPASQAPLAGSPDWPELAARWLVSGGDERIIPDPVTGLNRYLAPARPDPGPAYSSSTANAISAPAFAHVQRRLRELAPRLALSPDEYAVALEALRARIRASYNLEATQPMVFAPSGTDLEFVALAVAGQRADGAPVAGLHNILVGADEVGSGCIHSAHGQYFARTTVYGEITLPGAAVPGLGDERIELIDVPVRSAGGEPLSEGAIATRVEAAVEAAVKAGCHAIVHVVHGSKTGLVLPSLASLDRLIARFGGGALTPVVDACQARITAPAINAYLQRGAVVFITGSKFIGGPPFSGFALLPRPLPERLVLPQGFAGLFSRAEWPAGWAGAAGLPARANLGLLLRLEASVYELERFRQLPGDSVLRVIDAFEAAVEKLCRALGISRVTGQPDPDHSRMLECRTLHTLDLTGLPSKPDFDLARRWYESLAGNAAPGAGAGEGSGIRLGQPARCVRLPDGRWGGTLRIALSMPQIVACAALPPVELAARFAADMALVERRITALASAAAA